MPCPSLKIIIHASFSSERNVRLFVHWVLANLVVGGSSYASRKGVLVSGNNQGFDKARRGRGREVWSVLFQKIIICETDLSLPFHTRLHTMRWNPRWILDSRPRKNALFTICCHKSKSNPLVMQGAFSTATLFVSFTWMLTTKGKVGMKCRLLPFGPLICVQTNYQKLLMNASSSQLRCYNLDDPELVLIVVNTKQ